MLKRVAAIYNSRGCNIGQDKFDAEYAEHKAHLYEKLELIGSTTSSRFIETFASTEILPSILILILTPNVTSPLSWERVPISL